jgi:hypothetical protein
VQIAKFLSRVLADICELDRGGYYFGFATFAFFLVSGSASLYALIRRSSHSRTLSSCANFR